MRSKCGSSDKDEVNFNSPQLTKMSLSSFYLQSQLKMPIVSLFKFDKNKIYMIIKVAFLVMKMNIIPFVILLECIFVFSRSRNHPSQRLLNIPTTCYQSVLG